VSEPKEPASPGRPPRVARLADLPPAERRIIMALIEADAAAKAAKHEPPRADKPPVSGGR
jgi:hypothetical protein